MSIWDDRILEYLCNNRTCTPSEIANLDVVHVGSSNISRRLGKLKDHDLVRPLGNGVYEISVLGHCYLDHNYNIELEKFAYR